MRVPWNEDEAIIIVDAFYQYKNGIIKKNDAIKSVSARLREMAIKKGLEIDDVYRNENGITMQMAILEHIFSNGEKGLRSGSKLFRDTMQLYVDNYAEFELKKERIKSEPMKERFSNFIRSHFAYGIRIDSPIEVMRLRKFYSEDFGEECQMTDEEIKKMLFDSCFIHDGKGFIIASETEERIRTEIDELHRQGNEIIYYDELYAKNEEWFYGLGIFSSEMLKSYLGKKFKAINCKKSFFAWEALTENELLKNNITSLWGENVLRDYYGLKNDMEYIPIDKIKYALANNTCFVWNSAETYTIEHKFVISEDEKNTILEYVANNINVKGNVAFDDMPLESVFEENYELSDNAIFALVYNLVLSSNDMSYRAIVDELIEVPEAADTRDTEAVKRIATAYLKLLYPNVREASDISVREFKRYCLDRARKMRDTIKYQLGILDEEYRGKDIPVFTVSSKYER